MRGAGFEPPANRHESFPVDCPCAGAPALYTRIMNTTQTRKTFPELKALKRLEARFRSTMISPAELRELERLEAECLQWCGRAEAPSPVRSVWDLPIARVCFEADQGAAK